MSSELSVALALMFAVVGIVGAVAFSSIRAGLRPLGLWLLAWDALFISAAIVLWGIDNPAIRPIVYIFSSLVTPIMLVGTYAHLDREIPAWLLPFGILTAATRVGLYQMFGAPSATLAAALLEPPIAMAAAYLVWKAQRTSGDRMLAVGFVLLACAELGDASLRLARFPNGAAWINWVVLGLPLSVTQLVLYVSRLGHIAATSSQLAHTGEQRLRILTQSTGATVVEYDQFGTLTYVSESMHGHLDRPINEFIGRNAGDFFLSGDGSPIIDALRERGRITEEDVAKAEGSTLRTVRRDGGVVYYEAERTAYHTQEGELRILSHARNVTHRMLREEKTKSSEQRLSRAERIGNFGSWQYTVQTREFIWSDNLYRLHGLEPSPGPVDEDAIQKMVPPEDVHELGKFLDQLSQPPATLSHSELLYRVRRANDGKVRHLRVLCEVMTDEHGQVFQVHGATHDVTEQEQLETALRRGREHLDRLVESNIVGVFFGQDHGLLSQANDAFLSPLGYTQEDLPLQWKRISPPEERHKEHRIADSVIRLGSADPAERIFISKSGERIPMLVGAAQLSDDNAILIALDLSERKRAEAYIAKQHLELENTIAERTQQLLDSRTRLAEAQHLAAVGTLAAGVAHQINNPIGAILNSTEYALLCQDETNAQEIFRQALEVNLAEVSRCALIVKNMLKFSRNEPIEKVPTDVSRVIHQASRAITPYARDRQAHVALSLPKEPVLVRISPIEIEQAVVNILRNAIESREREAQIEVALRVRDKTAEVEVIDDGRGIEREHQAHLFEPFYSTRTLSGGTGLGLSVAHGVALDHGGQIHVASVPGEGTRVLLTLPLEETG